jgi:predicted DNA-binding transcriptional regulator YafY
LALAFYGPVWLLISWCELRVDFRAFRLDRMAEMTVLEERFAEERGKTLHDFVVADRARKAQLSDRSAAAARRAAEPEAVGD